MYIGEQVLNQNLDGYLSFVRLQKPDVFIFETKQYNVDFQ